MSKYDNIINKYINENQEEGIGDFKKLHQAMLYNTPGRDRFGPASIKNNPTSPHDKNVLRTIYKKLYGNETGLPEDPNEEEREIDHFFREQGIELPVLDATSTPEAIEDAEADFDVDAKEERLSAPEINAIKAAAKDTD